MMTNDQFARQSGEDPSSHFARLARELWGCVDELKRIAIPEMDQRLSRRLDTFERQLERLQYDGERNDAVYAERERATQAWRDETRARLKHVEDQVDGLRVAAGLPREKSSLFEIDLKTLVIAAIAVGAAFYGIMRQIGGVP